MRSAGRWIVSAAALLLVTGCSSVVEGEPAARSPASDPTPWDPCTIPDDAIAAAGLDLSTKESGVFGRDQNGFKICSWDDQPPEDWYSLAIFSGKENLAFIDGPAYFDRLRPVRVGSRDATHYNAVGADGSLDCGIAFDTSGGLVMATLITNPLVDGPLDNPCTQLARTIAELDSLLPA